MANTLNSFCYGASLLANFENLALQRPDDNDASLLVRQLFGSCNKKSLTRNHAGDEIRRVKFVAGSAAGLLVSLCCLALAEDFKTLDGKEYKDATVIRVELDGIVVKSQE